MIRQGGEGRDANPQGRLPRDTARGEVPDSVITKSR